MQNKKTAALVCSGGGALGLAELGIVSVLMEEGYSFDYFAGVSAGSIICSLLAIGWNPNEIWKFVQNEKLFRPGIDLSSKNKLGIIRGKTFHSLCLDVFGNTKIEDLQTPLLIGTTDFQTGENRELTSGLIADAVRPSCGIPIIFPPFWHEGEQRWLVDGGLSCNFPLNSTREKYKGKSIIGILTHAHLKPIDLSKKQHFSRKSFKKMATRTIRIMLRNQILTQKPDNRTILFEPNLSEFPVLSLQQKTFQKIYDTGRAYAEERLKEI